MSTTDATTDTTTEAEQAAEARRAELARRQQLCSDLASLGRGRRGRRR